MERSQLNRYDEKMKLFTRLTFYTVVVALVAVTMVTLLSIRKQSEILDAQGIAPPDIEAANGAVIKHSMFMAFILIVLAIMSYRLTCAMEKAPDMVESQRKSEIADELIHSVGNSINSVTIGIGTIRENMANRKLTNYLVSLANAVQEHQDDFSDYTRNDPQGQKIAPFIIALADDFTKHDRELTKTADRVYERAEHIANIIREAQLETYEM